MYISLHGKFHRDCDVTVNFCTHSITTVNSKILRFRHIIHHIQFGGWALLGPNVEFTTLPQTSLHTLQGRGLDGTERKWEENR